MYDDEVDYKEKPVHRPIFSSGIEIHSSNRDDVSPSKQQTSVPKTHNTSSASHAAQTSSLGNDGTINVGAQTHPITKKTKGMKPKKGCL